MGDSEVQERSLLGKAVDAAWIPVNAATSKPAQRAYIGTFLFAVTSFILFCISTTAYLLFYYNYIPQIGIERPIHLQFGKGNPFGTARLSSSLTSLQPYDISVYLHLPRTPANLAVGNFMVDLALLPPSNTLSDASDILPAFLSPINGTPSNVLRARRPAILSFASPMLDTAYRLSALPLYVIGWRKESERVEIKMFEGVEFARGAKNVPDILRLTIEADQKMQFYEVSVKIKAKFQGLRWAMYNHRILSFLCFTIGFYFVAMISASLVYFGLPYLSPPKAQALGKTEGPARIKEEPQEPEKGGYNPLSTSDLSETPRTFPSGSRQAPLEFRGRSEVKREAEAARVKREQEEIEQTTAIQPLAAEADDEDESDEGGSSWRDSGIGTGRESSDRRSVQKRRSGSLSNG